MEEQLFLIAFYDKHPHSTYIVGLYELCKPFNFM